jgi:hypothetical protein
VLRLGLSEVRGYAGSRLHDVLIAIDVSDSTMLSSGWDVDGDGPAGATNPTLLAWLERQPRLRAVHQRAAEVDLDDSVLMAEIAAVSALIERLDPGRDRVGLLVFSERAVVIAPLGSDREKLDAALAAIPELLPRLLRGTDFAGAIELATEALVREGDERQGSIVFLSDGAPTLPVGFPGTRQSTLLAARRAAALGCRIHAFALGSEALEALDTYGELAEITHGRLERLEAPGDLIARLRRVVLTDLARLEIRNLTTGSSATALRIFPNGSFDAFVTLVPGENHIVAAARLTDGSEVSASRRVIYEPGDSPPQREQLRSLMLELEGRTAEIELWAEMERSRRMQRKVLEIQAVEDASSDP